MKRTLVAAAILIAVPAAAQPGGAGYGSTPAQPPTAASPWSFDPARAQRNYDLLVRGQISFGQLSPQEFAEVKALDDYARKKNLYKPDKRTSRQKCLDKEIADAGKSPSRLELRSIDLKCGQD